MGDSFLAIGTNEDVAPIVSVKLTDLTKSSGKVLDCAVSSVQNTRIYCDRPELEYHQYSITVHYGDNLSKRVGTITRERDSFPQDYIFIIVGVVGGVAAIVAFIVCCVVRKYKTNADSKMKKYQDKMDNLEMTVAKECKEAFAELQTDMTEMTADIQNLRGLPFHSYNQYCIKILFPSHTDGEHPVMAKTKYNEKIQRGLSHFQQLIHNKTFLLTFVRTLEQQRRFSMKDRVDIASYLSVTLQGKMEYYTDILKTLLTDLIEKNMEANRDPKILLRRAESIAEKMLSNWFAFLLHSFLQECAGEHLYLLFRALKQQIDKGPVDAITGEARYSLSEDKVLRQAADYKSLTLRFISPDAQAIHDPQLVKVLDCDTISQVIDKILDTLYRNVHYSYNASNWKDKLILEWVKPRGETVIMYDDDPRHSKVEPDGCRPLARLSSYKIEDNATVKFTQRHMALPADHKSSLHRYDTANSSSGGNYYASSTGDSLSRTNSSNNILDMSTSSKTIHRYHLTKPVEMDPQHEVDRNKMVSEIYLTRLLATKGTLLKFIDDLFDAIFSTAHRSSCLPLAIKYMFDFLDDQALHHGITNQEVIHHWKSNSLPLRFWVNMIKNPDFVFDIHKSHTVDACLSVVAQIFMDSCSLTDYKPSKDSPATKLLFAKDIPKYRDWVTRYFMEIKSIPALSDQDMNSRLAEESQQHRDEFNTSVALFKLFQYTLDYRDEFMMALEEDEFARKAHLPHLFERVSSDLNCGSTRL